MMGWRKVGLIAAALSLAGCTQDEGPLGVTREQVPEAAQAALVCQADVQAVSLSCAPEQPTLPAGVSGAVLGGQGTYVYLESSNVTYEGVVFSADVTVRNLLTQALGTVDGVNLDAAGVRVFFTKAPTNGVTVTNASRGTFSGSMKDYFQYAQVLTPGEVSHPQTWQLEVPEGVTTFTFKVYVAAATVDESTIVPGFEIDPKTISAGGARSCALTLAGKAYCWGGGVLGNGSTLDQSTPVPVSDPAGGPVRFDSIRAGDDHTCALTDEGKAYCWGHGGLGQLGNGSASDQMTPVAVSDPAGGAVRFASISAGLYHTCAVTSGGKAYCWGNGELGQLGNGSTSMAQTPMEVSDPAGGPVRFASIRAGGSHTCAVTDEGKAFCWGYGRDGQLGNGSTSNQITPVAVSDPASGAVRFVSISIGFEHTCAVTDEGKAYCWGSGGNGQLGNGSTSNQSTPVAVPDPAGGPVRFASISAGDAHTCAVTDEGNAYCWGFGGNGRLGNGSASNQSTPVAVSDPVGGKVQFVAISARIGHTCAATNWGMAYCWGYGEFGQLGNGSASDQSVPVAVRDPAVGAD